MSVLKVLQVSSNEYSKNFNTLLLISILFALLNTFLTGFLLNFYYLVWIFVYCWFVATVYSYIHFKKEQVVKMSLGDCIKFGITKMGYIFFLNFAFGTVILLSYSLLLIPGIFLAVKLFYTIPLALTEDIDYIQVLADKSWMLTKNNFWVILWSNFIILVIDIVVSVFLIINFGTDNFIPRYMLNFWHILCLNFFLTNMAINYIYSVEKYKKKIFIRN